jgi:NAD+ synthase (glutamine-hydrolysing)
MNKNIKFAIYQFNSIVGDITDNTQKIIQKIDEAKKNNCDLFILPELAICGYPIEDILFRNNFKQEIEKSLEQFLIIDNITLFITAPRFEENRIYNSIYIINNGKIIDYYDKQALPNYGVFDDKRYFSKGSKKTIIKIKNYKIGLLICEDIWDNKITETTLDQQIDILCVVNASPFTSNKYNQRINLIKNYATKYDTSIIYLNMIGGQDDVVYDGGSFIINQKSDIISQSNNFQEDLFYFDYPKNNLNTNNIIKYPDKIESIYKALVLSVKDYVTKNNFKGCLLGLSGGIDSALTLAILNDAIGKDRIKAIMMPSIYTQKMSLEDSNEMIKLLNMENNYHIIDIWDIYQQFINKLDPIFKDLEIDTTEENLQARIRGNILMAISNKIGYLVVTTGNKSEMATGYSTLYGDMAGGFALLKDVYKTIVYQLAYWRNKISYIIPENIISRPPSAELKNNQLDSDSLPNYDVLDKILEHLIEDKLSNQDIIKKGFNKDIVLKITKLLKNTEYKRRQSAIGPKITNTSFTKDWRYPITHKFNF